MENEKKLETAIDEAIAITKSEDKKNQYDTAVSLEEYVRKYAKDEMDKAVENYSDEDDKSEIEALVGEFSPFIIIGASEPAFRDEFAKANGYPSDMKQWTPEINEEYRRFKLSLYDMKARLKQEVRKCFEDLKEKNSPKYSNDWWSDTVESVRAKLRAEDEEDIKERKDMVQNPKHYIFQIGEHEFQAIQVCKAVCTPEEFRGYLKTSYINYLLRADRKNGVEDLEKALTYLRWQIEFDKTGDITLPAK